MKTSVVEIDKDYVFNLRWIYEIQFTMLFSLWVLYKTKCVTVELNLSVSIE